MTCEHVKLPGGGTAIVCSRNKRRVRCSRCNKPSTKLCDFVTIRPCGECRGRGIVPDYVGLEMKCVGVECQNCGGSGGVISRTCDKPLCDACAVSVGTNRDHCPDHPPHAGAQLPLGVV